MGDTMNQEEQFKAAAIFLAREHGYLTLGQLLILREAVASVALSQHDEDADD